MREDRIFLCRIFPYVESAFICSYRGLEARAPLCVMPLSIFPHTVSTR